VLDYLQHGAGVDAGRLAALAARDGKFQDGRVHCEFELKVR